MTGRRPPVVRLADFPDAWSDGRPDFCCGACSIELRSNHVHPECAHCHAPFACDGAGCRPRYAFPEPTCAACLSELRAAFAASLYRFGADDDEVAHVVAREFGEAMA